MSGLDRCSDAALLARTGDEPEAFGIFYRRHADRLLGYLAGRTADADLAADLMAEAFAAAYVAAHRYREADGQPAIAWLFVIARNKLIDSARRGRAEDSARRRLNLERLGLDDADYERIAEARQRFSADRVLDGLPQHEADAIRARILEERSYSDIAQSIGCSPVAVRKRVSRGLERLRTRLENSS